MRDNTLYDIKAAVNVFRFVADMINDIAILEKEYDFKFTELNELLTRIKFDEILKGNDVELLKSVVMFLPMQKILEEFSTIFNASHSKKRTLQKGCMKSVISLTKVLEGVIWH